MSRDDEVVRRLVRQAEEHLWIASSKLEEAWTVQPLLRRQEDPAPPLLLLRRLVAMSLSYAGKIGTAEIDSCRAFSLQDFIDRGLAK
jgi:hypothetical protein